MKYFKGLAPLFCMLMCFFLAFFAFFSGGLSHGDPATNASQPSTSQGNEVRDQGGRLPIMRNEGQGKKTSQSPSTKEKNPENPREFWSKSLKEIDALQKQVQRLQERLGQAVNASAPSLGKKEAPQVSFSQHVDMGLDFLTKRLNRFILGVLDVGKVFHILSLIPSALTAMILPIGLCLFLAIIGCAVGRLIIKKRESALKALRYRHPFDHFILYSSLLFASSLAYIIISLVAGQALKFLALAPPSLWRLSYGALLPFHFYLAWALWHWVRGVCSPRRPSIGFIMQNPRGAYLSALYLRLAIIVYLSFSIFFVFMDFLPKTAIRETRPALMDIAILSVTWLVLKAFGIMRTYLSPNQNRRPLLSILLTLRILVGAFGVAWIFSPHQVIVLTPLLLMTAILILISPPVYRWLWRKQRGLVWRMRRSPGHWWITFLSHPKLVFRLVSALLLFAIAYVWLMYDWAVELSLSPMVAFLVRSFLRSQTMNTLLHIIFIVMVAIFIVKSGDRVLKYYIEDKYNSESGENNFFAGRLKTLMAMLRTLLRIIIGIPAISLILSQLGDFNLTTIMTSVGAASFGLTFGFQNIVKDFINGFFIILENNLMVGDEVDVDQRVGKVEAITLRTLKVRADNGMLLTIPFGSIIVIGNKNRHFSAVLMNISVGYGTDIEKVHALIDQAFSNIKRIPGINRCIRGAMEFRGVNEVTSYAIILQAKITTAPNTQDAVRRAFNRQLKRLFDEAGISVPTSQHSVNRLMPSLTNTQ